MRQLGYFIQLLASVAVMAVLWFVGGPWLTAISIGLGVLWAIAGEMAKQKANKGP